MTKEPSKTAGEVKPTTTSKLGKVVPALRRLWHSSWAGPVLKAAGTTTMVVGLAWLGDRHAARVSSRPHPQQQAGVVAAGIVRGQPWRGKGRRITRHRHPRHGKSRTASSALQPSASSAAASSDAKKDDAHRTGVLSDGRVILNEADEKALCRLPGVGPARAQRILRLRRKLGGRFRSIR